MSQEKNQTPEQLGSALKLHAAAGRGRRWRRWIFLLVLAAGGLLALTRWQEQDPAALVQYKTVTARQGTLVITVDATGNLEPTNQVEVGSEQSGIVSSVLVDINDEVEVNQVLAQLDDTKMKAQIAQARASLESSKAKVLSCKATVAETRSNLARLKELSQISTQRAVSQQDLDTAQAALDRAIADQAQAQASVNQAEATLSSYETDLSKMTIRSPINGVVLTRSIDPGQTVAASFQAPELFLLAEDLSKMQLNVDVDEAEVGLVEPGQEATFTVDAYSERTFPARIDRVSYGSTTTDNVVTYETVLDVDNAELMLRPGMTATATITVKKIENTLLVPNEALRFSPPIQTQQAEQGGSLLSKLIPRPPRTPAKPKAKVEGAKGSPKQATVWTLQGGQLTPVQVTLGLSDGNHTQVTQGELTDGTELVVDTLKAQP